VEVEFGDVEPILELHSAFLCDIGEKDNGGGGLEEMRIRKVIAASRRGMKMMDRIPFVGRI
jgi:hypothetical protein